MQNALADGSSCYFLQMMQQLHRRLHPSRQVPQTEADMMGLSMLHYLERQGGYRGHRELGLVAWVLGHAIDSAAQGDFKLTKEILALLMVAVEQAVTDRGDWTMAYMLTLMEEPPLQMFQERSMNVSLHAKPFGPLVPPQWTAVCLSYLKDLEVLSTKKTETAKKASKAIPPAASASASAEPDQEASPKRKATLPPKTEKQVASGCMKGGRPPAGQVELEADLPVNGGLIKRGGLLNKSGLITSGGNRKCPRCKAGDYDGVRCNACGFWHQPIPGTSSLAVDTLDFYRWCSFLAISVLRTRCSFAVFLRSTLHLPRSSVASESPAFPLPIPYCDVFARMPPGLSSIKRRRIAFRRALHVVVMALNFWWAGSSFISLELLGRVPSPSQRGILKRLSSMLLADGPLETFQALRSGRRFPELVARLTDLSCVLTKPWCWFRPL